MASAIGKFSKIGKFQLYNPTLASKLWAAANRPTVKANRLPISNPLDKYPAIAPSQASRVTTPDGRSLINLVSLFETISIYSAKKPIFNAEELTSALEKKLTYRAPLSTLNQLLQSLVTMGLLNKIEDRYYCLPSLSLVDGASALEAAKGRSQGAWNDFIRIIDGRTAGAPSRCSTLEEIRNTIFEGFNGYVSRTKLGFRGVYAFTLNNEGKLVQAFCSSSRESAYRKAQSPSGVFKQVLEGERILSRVELGTTLESAIQAFSEAGFTEVDAAWVANLHQHNIRTIDLIKLVDEKGQPVGILMLRDPIYFGAEHQAAADAKLVAFGKAIGVAVGTIRKREQKAQGSITWLDASGNPLPEENWPDTEEKAKKVRIKPKIPHAFIEFFAMKWRSLKALRTAYGKYKKEHNDPISYYYANTKIAMEKVGYGKVWSETAITAYHLFTAMIDGIRLITPRLRRSDPGRFAFFIHPRDDLDVYRQYPFFKYLPRTLMYELVKYLPPITAAKMTLQDPNTGKILRGDLLSIVLTPQHMLENGLFAAKRAVQLAMLAKKKGVSIAGLGALLPSLTRYGTLLSKFVPNLPITTGHAFTSATIANTALKAREIVAPGYDETIAIVGAAGSTGFASAHVLAEKGVRNLLLVEKEGKEGKLKELADELLTKYSGMQLTLTTHLSNISKARIVITVTNATEAIIKDAWVKPGMIFVDDAQPPNVSEEMANARQDIAVLKVLATVPGLDPHFDFGLGTDPGTTFTCLAETVILAKAGWTGETFTTGYVKPGEASLIESIARVKASEVRLPDDFYSYAGRIITPDDIRELGKLWQS